jgi:hypothetical protein
MKKLLFACCLFATVSLYAIDLTVSPTNASWMSEGMLELSITNFSEEAVDLLVFVDVDGNERVDGDDFLVAQFEIDDGMRNGFGAVTFVDDKDGLTNGAIETAISFYGINYNYAHTIGDYLIRAVELDDNDNWVATSTVPFSVTQPLTATWISGEVLDAATSNAVPGARVELEYYSEIEEPIPAIWADTNGQFTLYIPSNVPIVDLEGIYASAHGYLSVEEDPDTYELVSFAFFSNEVTTGQNTLDDPLLVVPAGYGPGLYEITGTVYWVESWPGHTETNELGGVLVKIEGEDDDLFSWDVTAQDGSFTMTFPGDANGVYAEIFCENPLLNLRGIVGTHMDLSVTGAMPHVEIYCYSAESLARAAVTDEQSGAPLVGVEVYFESSNFVGNAYTRSNGVYEIGLLAGTYEAGCEGDSLRYLSYLETGWQSGLSVTQETIFTNAPFEAERGWPVSGHVYDTNDTPQWDCMVTTLRENDNGGEQWLSDTDTRYDGSYSLLSSTGDVYIRTDVDDYGDGSYLINLYYSNQVVRALSDVDPVTVTTNGLSGIDFYLPTGARVEGRVVDQNNNPVAWLRVEAVTADGICMGSDNTEWGGGFGFALPEGNGIYLRTAIDYGQWSPRTWYGDTCSQDLADSVGLTNEVTRSNLTIQVFPGYELNGHVRDQNGLAGLSGATVTAFDVASNRYDTVYADGSGQFNSFYVPTNVPLAICADVVGYEGEFYDNVYDPFEATGIQTSAYNNLNVQFVLHATGADSDDDGLPDSQEDSRPDGIYSNGVDYTDYHNPDTDGDDFDDGDEYGAGTDPQDGDSLFDIVQAQAAESGLFLGWASVSGRQYNVQQCTNLISGVWSNIYTVVASNSTTTVSNSAALKERGFFRVQVVTP